MATGINLLPSSEKKDKGGKRKNVIIEMTSPKKGEKKKKREGGVLHFFQKAFRKPTPSVSQYVPPTGLASLSKKEVKDKEKKPPRPHVELHMGSKKVDRPVYESEDKESSVGQGASIYMSPPPAPEKKEVHAAIPARMPPPPSASEKPPKEEFSSQDIKIIKDMLKEQPPEPSEKGPGAWERFTRWLKKLFASKPKTRKAGIQAPPPPTPAPAPPPPQKPQEVKETTQVAVAPPPLPPLPPKPPAVPPPPTPVPPKPPEPKPVQAVQPPPPPAQPPKKEEKKGPGLWTRFSAWMKKLFSSKKKPGIPPAPLPPIAEKPAPEKIEKKVKKNRPAHRRPLVDEKNQFSEAPEFEKGRLHEVNLVPDDLLGESQPMKRIRTVGFVAVIGIIIVALAYTGIWWYMKDIIGKTEDIDLETAQVREEIDAYADFRQEAELLKRHVNDLSYVLDHHLHWNEFFKQLEKHTLASDVYYSTISVNTSGSVTIAAVGRDNIAVARQLTLLQNSPTFAEDVSITSLVPLFDTETGLPAGQSFSISLQVPEALFLEE
ncbi:PilN domain-containing protein [Patescibacteria group bacterium]